MRIIPRMTTSFQLRQYQRDAFAAIFESWNEHRRVIANLPTGLGKTALAAAVMQETVATGGRCVFIADTNELCEQPLRGIRKVTGEIPSLEKLTDRAMLTADYTVASLQTLARESRLGRFPRDHFDVVVFDASHRRSNNTSRSPRISTRRRSSASPRRRSVPTWRICPEYYDAVAYSMDIAHAIDLGLMPPIMIDTAPIKIDISMVRQSATANGQDYNATELGDAIRPYDARVAQYILAHAADRHIAAYLPLVACSKEFVSVCRGAGIRAIHVDGEDPDRDRKLVAFERRDVQMISCSALLTTGWDVPHVDCICNLRPTRSVGLFRQIVGRGTSSCRRSSTASKTLTRARPRSRHPRRKTFCFSTSCGRPANSAFADRRRSSRIHRRRSPTSTDALRTATSLKTSGANAARNSNANSTPPPNATRNSSRSRQSPVWSMRRTSSTINRSSRRNARS